MDIRFRYAKCGRHSFSGGGISAAGHMEVFHESFIAARRSEFRYAKCDRHSFSGGGISAAGHMEVCYG